MTEDSTDTMRMASFRIDRDLWAKFGAIAKRERLTVTDVLTDYIQRCTDNDRTEYGFNTGNDNSVISSNYSNDNIPGVVKTVTEESLQAEIKAQIEPLADSIEKLEHRLIERTLDLTEAIAEIETRTQERFKAVCEEIKAIGERSVTTDEIASSITEKTNHKIAKPEGEPDWVTNETRTFYRKLVDDAALLGKVAEAIESNPDSNAALAQEIVSLGFSKADGTPLGSDKMSRIRKVVKQLSATD